MQYVYVYAKYMFTYLPVAKWSVHFFKDLYEKLLGMAIQSKGLNLVPKLKQEHVNLTSYARMRVDLAAQVMCM